MANKPGRAFLQRGGVVVEVRWLRSSGRSRQIDTVTWRQSSCSQQPMKTAVFFFSATDGDRRKAGTATSHRAHPCHVAGLPRTDVDRVGRSRRRRRLPHHHSLEELEGPEGRPPRR